MLRIVKVHCCNWVTLLQGFRMRPRSLLLATMKQTFRSNGMSAQHRCLHPAVYTSRTPRWLSMESTSMVVLGMYCGITHLPEHLLFRAQHCKSTGSGFR